MNRFLLSLSIVVAVSGGSVLAGSSSRGGRQVAFGVNLVVNGDAEAGPGSPNDGSKLMDIPGWTRTGVFQVVQYGASGGFADDKSPGPESRGKNYSVGGPGSNNDTTSAEQTIDVSSLSSTLKSGKSKFELSAYLGGYSNQADYAYVTASFLDANSKVLTTAKLPAVTPAERKYATGMLPRSTSGTVPAGTKKVLVKMVSVRKEGAYHDGSIDNVVLKFSK